METAAGTWNGCWADPASRRQLLLAKFVWMAIVAGGVTVLTAGLLWIVGSILYGSASVGPVENIHWTRYLWHHVSPGTPT